VEYDSTVHCSLEECREAATYKIAAPWANGPFSELKTYGFACGGHVREVFRDAEGRWLEYEPVRGETVQELGVFHFEPGAGDRRLARDRDLEQSLRT
jgi:hypothetical protein